MGAVAHRGSTGAAGAAALAGAIVPAPAPVTMATATAPRQQLSDAARAAMAKGVPAQTARGYAGDWQRFEQWAAEHGLRAMPASAETLTEYVAWLTVTPRPRTGRPYKPSSIDRAMASIAGTACLDFRAHRELRQQKRTALRDLRGAFVEAARTELDALGT